MTKFRVVNKSKDTIIIDVHPKGLLTLSWSNFNSTLKLEKKIYAVVFPNILEQVKPFEELFEEAAKMYYTDDNHLNELSQRIVDESGITAQQFMVLLHIKIWQYKEQDKKINKAPKKFKKKSPKKVVNKPMTKTALGNHPEFEKLRELLKSE